MGVAWGVADAVSHHPQPKTEEYRTGGCQSIQPGVCVCVRCCVCVCVCLCLCASVRWSMA
jgi:hypothetical protein